MNNLKDFWKSSEYANKGYLEESLSEELINKVESTLGYKLPVDYINLMKIQNGGIPENTCFPTNESTSWAEDHVAISAIMGIGFEKKYSICGSLGSQFMIDEWEYPNDGIYICTCPSAGHDMILLDYSKCGAEGEPEVVHVDQELDYKKTFLANNFSEFIVGLVNESEFDNSEEELYETLEIFKNGRFSNILQKYFKADKTINFDKVLRNLFEELTKEKGYFALHDDPLSYLAYDIQFYLLSINKRIKSKEQFVSEYPSMVAMGDNEISIGGYADFFSDWYDLRLRNMKIKKGFLGRLKFTDDYKITLFKQIEKYK
ncbi:SMI1/KNR4 family protein [Aureivirga sp. CE67]|uniref:SMI1/KNR4 family protein n=1 Tax=Aureivirga sp. CE67 TaxID=1788983 RepID=UPI0018CA4084|nr:SMI1/KNR4 family protein [Aureivirga sp. CE67]